MILFDDWSSLLRIAITTPVVYFAVVLLIRLSGKRSTSKMNSFDWIVTVAIGSMVASVILLEDVVALDALEAITILLALQYLVTKLSISVPGFSQIIHFSPTLLFFQGEFLEKAMKSERITRSEMMSAIRQAGQTDLDAVAAVVLESDASLSVIPRHGGGNLESLKDIPKPNIGKPPTAI